MKARKSGGREPTLRLYLTLTTILNLKFLNINILSL